MNYLTWQGSPGHMVIVRLGQLRIGLSRWNNLAPRNTHWDVQRKVGDGGWYVEPRWYEVPGLVKAQVVVPLRRFNVNRKSLYLRVTWGYQRKGR